MLAAALRVAGFDPVSAEQEDGARATFYYDVTPELSAALNGYNDRSLMVPAKTFAGAVHDIRQQFIGR